MASLKRKTNSKGRVSRGEALLLAAAFFFLLSFLILAAQLSQKSSGAPSSSTGYAPPAADPFSGMYVIGAIGLALLSLGVYAVAKFQNSNEWIDSQLL